MKIGVPAETAGDETRVALIPDTVALLTQKGLNVVVETGAGTVSGYSDDAYREAGALMSSDRAGLLADADVVTRVSKPLTTEVNTMKENAVHVSLLDPFNDTEEVKALAGGKIKTFSLQMIPRTTKAQKMDVLNSLKSSIAGYAATILAAESLNMLFPMMVTPAGTLKPARVFIIGAGVAGLQAIATAKRLGARVEAFDTRPVVEEQVQSLGARFVKVDLGDTGETKDGYAKALTEEQLAKQREAMKRHCAASDAVITTALLFGKKAPVIITEDILEAMKPGSIIIDLAAEGGGNVAGTQLGEETVFHGVRVMGFGNLAKRYPYHASQMFSSNVGGFLLEYWDDEKGVFDFDPADEIIAGCLITDGGEVVNDRIREFYQ